MIKILDKKNSGSHLTMCFLFMTLLAFTGCNNNRKPSDQEQELSEGKEVSLGYAKGFRIIHFPGYKKLIVKNPWQGAEDKTFSYWLVDRNKEVPDELIGKKIIRTPVEKVVCLSTTHIALLEFIDEISTLTGLSSPRFANNEKVKDALSRGEIIDVGYEKKLNFEKIVHLKPDLVMGYGISSSMTAYLEKLDELGITVVMNGEYLERDPLAKAEWVKFVAEFYNKDKIASNRFDKVVQEYNSVKQIADNSKNNPQVLSGLPWKGVWYVPGGKSFAAKLIKDAGGNYLWAENSTKEAIPLDIEIVYEKSLRADCWINPGAALSVKDILGVDQRLKELEIIKNGRIFNNNALTNKSGGNDYWESGVTNPHIILKDLVKIFHPNLLPDHQLVYYQKLKK